MFEQYISECPVEELFARIDSDYFNDEKTSMFDSSKYSYYRFSNIDENFTKESQASVIIQLIAKYYLFEYIIDCNYFPMLLRKKKQLTYIDEYDEVNDDDWNSDLLKFIRRFHCQISCYLRLNIPAYYQKFVLQNNLELKIPGGLFYDANDSAMEDQLLFDLNECLNYTEATIESCHKVLLPCTEDPDEFQQYILNKFSVLGWKCSNVPDSDDRPAEIKATKDDIQAVILSKPDAEFDERQTVAEICTVRDYYDAELAVVIANRKFSKSTRELADDNHVYLLHHAQIEDFDLMIFDQGW